MTKSILYYTSNKENPSFEQKIIDDLLSKKGELSIISVSQKPMELGQNICVGDIGFSYLSEYKQMLAGAKLATTEYIITVESDVLYSSEYFQFEPTDKDIYRYDNIWIVGLLDNYGFHKKRNTSEGAQVIKRDYLIKILENYINNPDPFHSPYNKQKIHTFHGNTPVISIKTGNGMNLRTSIIGESVVQDLSSWGNIKDFKKRFL